MNMQPQKKPQQNEKRAEPKQPPVRTDNAGGERDEPRTPEEARKQGNREH